jgi:uncharacterized protein (TIGR02452 family)
MPSMNTEALLNETLQLTENSWGSSVVMDMSKVTGSPELPGRPHIEITGEAVQDAALRFRGQRVTVLNFASGSMPGGGVRYGSLAQEECICLSSGLLYGLEGHMEYYEANRSEEAPHECYDSLIWSENVPLIRDGRFNLVRGEDGYLVEPMRIQVITYPAPIATGRLYRGEGVYVDTEIEESSLVEVFYRRCRHVVRRAEKAGTDVLVLGAWGCGAYGNDPLMVAHAFQAAVATQSGSIKRVVFAIYGVRSNQDAFKQVFT